MLWCLRLGARRTHLPLDHMTGMPRQSDGRGCRPCQSFRTGHSSRLASARSNSDQRPALAVAVAAVAAAATVAEVEERSHAPLAWVQAEVAKAAREEAVMTAAAAAAAVAGAALGVRVVACVVRAVAAKAREGLVAEVQAAAVQ